MIVILGTSLLLNIFNFTCLYREDGGGKGSSGCEMDEPWIMTVKSPHGLKGLQTAVEEQPRLPPVTRHPSHNGHYHKEKHVSHDMLNG